MSGNRKELATVRLAVEEPPYLAVGTEVSAKYRGAFCEAKLKSIKKLVKCKVNFENGGGSSTVTDDCIVGELKVGSDVKVKLPDGQDMVGTLVKITDSSSYTVVFDDGDERTLKRTSLCIKGEKHFNESETLDHLPLTDPENFGTPVMQQGKKSRKGRRNSQSLDEVKEDEDTPARKKLCVKGNEDADKVVMIDSVEKKKSFQLPALLLCSIGSHNEVKSPGNVLVRSFKDGKLIEVHPRDVKEFSKESVVNSTLIKGENPSLKSAVEHAVKYLETKQLPSNWSDDTGLKPDEILKNECSDHSSSSEAESDGDEHERSEFLENLTKFLEDKGTPLLRAPVLGHRDLDLYKLFKIVSKMKGMDNVDSWQSVYKKMNIPIITTTASYHIKNAYKRYLYDYEIHIREEDDIPLAEKLKKLKNDLKTSVESTVDNASESFNQEEETPVGSDSEKDLKETPLFEDHKLPGKRALKRGRNRRKTRIERSKSLKSPNSPGLSPLSPCSPKSFSSVSAPESTGCPSPADNYCDVRELRGKIDAVLEKSNGKGLPKGEEFRDIKSDLPDKNREIDLNYGEDSCNYKTRKEKKDRICKENISCEISLVKLENTTVNIETNSQKGDEAGGSFTKDDGHAESKCNEDTLSKEDEKYCVKDGKNIQDGDDPDDDESGKTVDIDTHVDNQGQEGTDVEDAVDVVNSPSGTSETVDSDDRGERKTEKKGKKNGKGEGSGKTGAKSNDVSDDADGLEYKLNDRIDVRYGRGRNATVYHAKITCVDPSADEGRYYLVHYQGWNARHDEWIGDERIIGRGVKQTRTRTIKEPTKSIKPTPKPSAKPTPKPVAKKNGKNGTGHVGRPAGSKTRKRTPSPTLSMLTSSRNGNGRACKNRKDNTSEKAVTDPSAEVKFPARITRRNSLTVAIEASEQDFLDQKSPDSKSESEKEAVSSPCRGQRNANQDVKSPSPNRNVEKTLESDAEKGDKLEDVKLEENASAEKTENKTSETSVESLIDVNSKVDGEKTLKRSRDDEGETSSTDSPPTKKKPEDKDSSGEEVFERDTAENVNKETNDPGHPEPEPTVEDTSGPDLTCSEQLPTNCTSPDPYTTDFPGGERFYGNGIEGVENGNESKGKDSSSSLDEGKVEKPAPSRKTRCRRGERKARAPSSQSSIDTECQNGTSNSPSVTVVLSPSWTPQYNFTKDLDELLKNEESSERIRLLTERIKDIRKVYGELKSEVANIDRKRKRRLKRKREEELSTEESAAKSPSRSSPLTTTTAVSSANALAAVECR